MSYQEHGPTSMAKPPEGLVAPLEPAGAGTFPETHGRDACIGGWVFYDADCALCAGSAKRAAGFLGRHGFALVPLQTPGTSERVGVVTSELFARMHLLTCEGRRFAGADALVEIARHIGWARPLAFVAGSSRVMPWLRRIYDWVAANRYCFGGTCRLPRRHSALDWRPLVILPAVALALRDDVAGWVFMWAMAFALFAGCKWLTYRKAVANGAKLGLARTLGYLFGWVGMDADAFTRDKSPRIPAIAEWLLALGRMFAGAVLVWGVARMVLPYAALLSGWVAMFGFILLLHFGTFQLLALAWQRAGVPVELLMRAPLLATSLGDFWGARWNTGFHAVAHEFLFRPLNRLLGGFAFQHWRRIGTMNLQETPNSKIQTPNKHQAPNTKGRFDGFAFPKGADSPVRLAQVDETHRSLGGWSFFGSWILVFGSSPWALGVKRLMTKSLPVLGVFFVSGLIHEIVITLPARGGYGLPTAYFLLQGIGLALERRALGRRLGLGAGLRGRVFAIVVAATPAFWLFPPVFVRNVVLPMLEAIGAL